MKLIQPWADAWHIDEKIEGGGQGEVTIMRRILPPNEKAILKQIVERWRDDAQAKERMRQEAQALTSLQPLGARVPAVYDSLLQHPEGEPFILMEFIEGKRFDKWLRERGSISPAEAFVVTKGIAEVVQLCHANKIGHRDLKPANIILKDGDPRAPYVIDFGISFDSRQTMTLTKNGEIFRNEFITLPECQDLEGGERDLRSDLTALAGLFFYCIAGRPPIVLLDAQDRQPHRRSIAEIEKAASSASQTEDLIWFLKKALANNIDQRFQTMEEFIRALEKFSSEGKPQKKAILDKFERLKSAVIENDKGVRLQLLIEKSNRLIQSIGAQISARLIKEGLSVETIGAGANAVGSSKPMVFDGTYLEAASLVYFKLGIPHYGHAAFAFVGPVAVGRELHYYVGRTIGPPNGLYRFKRPIDWQKAIVIELEDNALSSQKCSALEDAVISALMAEIDSLMPSSTGDEGSEAASLGPLELPAFSDEHTLAGVDEIVRFLTRNGPQASEVNLAVGIGHNKSTANNLVSAAVKSGFVKRTVSSGQHGVELTSRGRNYAATLA